MGTLARIGRALLLLLLIGGPVLACAGQEVDEFCGQPPTGCKSACCRRDFCYGSAAKDCNHSGCETGMCCPDFRPGPVAPEALTRYYLDRALAAQTSTPRARVLQSRPLEGELPKGFLLQGHDQPPVPPPRV